MVFCMFALASLQARLLAAVLEMSPCSYPRTDLRRNMRPISREQRKITPESMLPAELTCFIPRLPLVNGRRGGLMVSALDYRSSGPGSSPGWDTALCSRARHLTLTVPLFTQLAARFINGTDESTAGGSVNPAMG